MAGITYQLVKRYEDRFIYSIIIWKSKCYSPTSTGNKVSLVVDDISKYNDVSGEYGWNEKDLLLKDEDPIDVFLRIFIARFRMGKIERDAFERILDGLEVGQGINELRKAYKKAKDEVYLKEHTAFKIRQKQQKMKLEKERKEERNEKKRELEKKREKCEYQKEWATLRSLLGRRYLSFKKQMEAVDEETRRTIIRNYRRKIQERVTVDEEELFPPYIHKPFWGKYDNSSNDVFDYIEVDVSYTELVLDRYFVPMVQLNKDNITKSVIEVITKSEEYNRYGVPINFLKLKSLSIDESSRELHYLFVLKELHQ